MLAWACGGCALWPAGDAAGGAKAAATPASAPAPALRLQVDAPAAVRPLLERYLDLARLQELSRSESIDAAEVARLIAAAPAQVRDLLQTEGYFSADVKVRAEPGVPTVVRVEVQPGPRTRVASLQVQARGELGRRLDDGDNSALALLGSLQTAGTLRPGVPFTNAGWSDTKQQLLARLRSAGYAAASLAGSRADVDAATQRAALHVDIDSGPMFVAGPLRIEGLKRHDESTVRALAGFGPGAPLTEARLLDYQERLQKAGLFESVLVSFDPAPAQAAAAPVVVRLSELPLQQATVGVGYSANTGQRVTLDYTQRRLFGQAVTAQNKFIWGRDEQSWSGDFQTHPRDGFYRNLLGAQIDRVRSSVDQVLTQRLRLGRSQETPRIERLVFAELLQSRQSDAAGVNRAAALSGNLQWVIRDLDSLLLPTRGYTLSLQVGAGGAAGNGGRGPFSRLYGRITGYHPLGGQWYGQARLELGQIVKRNGLIVPDALGFRAGGDDSVRGYAYRSLAPDNSLGGIVSGSELLTTSVEVAHPILASLPSLWGALFVDAGRAVDNWADYRPALGYGAGVHWRSPIGPLRVDLAWGQDVRRLRLHLSVGVAL